MVQNLSLDNLKQDLFQKNKCVVATLTFFHLQVWVFLTQICDKI